MPPPHVAGNREAYGPGSTLSGSRSETRTGPLGVDPLLLIADRFMNLKTGDDVVSLASFFSLTGPYGLSLEDFDQCLAQTSW